MTNLTINNNSPFGLIIKDPVFKDDFVTRDVSFTAETILPAGTLLSRAGTAVPTTEGFLVPFFQTTINPNIGIPLEFLPVAILMEEVDLTVPNVEVPSRVLIGGQVRIDDLIVYSNASLPPEPMNEFTRDLLRSFNMIALNTQQLAELDNQ